MTGIFFGRKYKIYGVVWELDSVDGITNYKLKFVYQGKPFEVIYPIRNPKENYFEWILDILEMLQESIIEDYILDSL